MIKGLSLEGGKPAATPGVPSTEPRSEEEQDNPKLTGSEATNYRAITARLNFLSQDRPDIQYSVKEVSRWMSSPRGKDLEALKRIGKYLLGKPRATFFYRWQRAPTELTSFSDTDWAGCRGTRKSTSTGTITHGDHYIKSWSSQQSLVSLSSAEAELYGVVKASSETLGAQAMAGDFGHTQSVRIYADASAALGIVHKKGLGKVRHIDTNTMCFSKQHAPSESSTRKSWER